MVKIVRYEVYSDRGEGWKLVEQFSGEERQNASFCAKEVENGGSAVKIIREIYETDDGSFVETVEYIGGLKNKNKKISSIEDELFEDLKGEYNVEATPFKMLAENQVSKAILKLILIVCFSLLLTNILTSLFVPVVEFMVPEEKRKSILFIFFLSVFIILAAPLLLYKVPWNVFYSLRKGEKELINEKKFFRKAATLLTFYNLNDNGKEVIVPVFPEAPVEYKQYIIDYLTQILNNLNPKIKISDSFNRLGVELVIYGGCLQLARYGHLMWAEANSLMYEAFKVLCGEQVDLQAFYDAKRTYQDNKVAVFLTGVGAYLMSQIINDIPMDAGVLQATLEKWISFNTQPETDSKIEALENEHHEGETEIQILFDCCASIRWNMGLFDEEKEIGENEQNRIKNDITKIMKDLETQYKGENISSENNIYTVYFTNLGKAIGFLSGFNEKLEDYKDNVSQYNLMTDVKMVLIEQNATPEEFAKLNSYTSDILEYAYNQEIVVTGTVKDELLESPYSFEFLGDKLLHKMNKKIPLYKMHLPTD